ncbi:MAG: Fis family transcriptional regulator [Phycisphaerales bacterium]|nr:Fis family transcriptional regulator [Phycisphaerales bacterium]
MTSELPPPTVLLVDDNPANLDLLTRVLEPQGYRILVAQSGEAAIALARRATPDLILLDIMLPGVDGYETCRRLKGAPETAGAPVVFISARNDTSSLVEGFGAGGVDYVVKPFQAEEVVSRVGTHLRLSRLARELAARNEELERQIARREKAEEELKTAGEQISALSRREAERWGVDGFIGKSKTIGKILQDVRRLQNFSSVNVLINGESGTGKELVARAVHSGSARGKGPFIAVNCVAIPEDLAESMFFGHMKGAFTGAMLDRRGYFELAHEGTLFLDEIGDMSPLLQAKLLRVLEDGKVTPLGATRERQVSVRIVAATNADLEARIAAGMFRQDLYFRLAQFTVQLPPLRMRKEDVPLLAGHFLTLFATEMGMKPPPLTSDAVEALRGYAFPGNVRELKNIIERGLIESGGDPIGPEHLKLAAPVSVTVYAGAAAAVESGGEGGVAHLPLRLDAAEEMLIKRALAETGGNVAEAARRLGVNRTRIYRRLAQES